MKHFSRSWIRPLKAVAPLILAVVMVVALIAVSLPVVAATGNGDTSSMKPPSGDPLNENQGAAGIHVLNSESSRIISEYGLGEEEFEEVEIGDLTVYWHQRMIGDAIVEGDSIVLQFDKNTGELLKERIHWRGDLTEYPPPAIGITIEQAESMVRGEVQSSKLYIISPESDVFPLDPAPENPCWVVTSVDNIEMIVTIIDSVNGKILGYGVPPPYTGFSLSGPQYHSPCSGTWTSWYQSAETWFNAMGYPTEAVQWPTEAKVQSHVQSTDTAMFYELAHGGSAGFSSGCVGGTTYEPTYASEVETWMAGYTKMPFTFIGSCGGMCDTTDNTLSYEFRKGSTVDTATVGYCGMDTAHCEFTCWPVSVSWQNALFDYMDQGWTVKAAFDQAQADYPQCASAPACMRFAGDTSFAAVPVVERGTAEPDISVDPTSLETTLVQDTSAELALNIANVGVGSLEVDICDEETETPSPAVAPNDNVSGYPGEEPVSGEPVLRVRKVENAAPDDNQPAPGEPAIREGRSVPSSDVEDAIETATTHAPIWEMLQGLDQAEKENASLQLEVGTDLDAATMDGVRNVESLWNSGAFAEAIEGLKALETGGLAVAAGLSWKTPQPVEPADWGGDVRISTRDHILETHLDSDAETGNLFAVLRMAENWAISISTNGGQTWQETFYWTGGPVVDVSAAVVDDYLFIGYAADDGAGVNKGRMRRAFVSNGAIDSGYFWVEVFDKGVGIAEIALCTNADFLDNRVYYYAILANNSLVFFWDDPAAVSWAEISTGVTDAMSGLDATWHEGYTGSPDYWLYASYIGSGGDNPVMVLRYSSSGWEAIEVLSDYTGWSYGTSVSAYEDTVICMYEHDYTAGSGIRYNISYDYGDSWSAGWWDPPAGNDSFYPDVTAHGGLGTACVYSDEAGVFDPVWYRFREGYQPGVWGVVEQINEKDAYTGRPNRIEYLRSSSSAGYGVIFISEDPVTGTAYFDRTDSCMCVNDAPWMSVSPTSGTVNPSEDMDVTVSFDASGLSPGTYEGNIKIGSNDPDEGCVTVPVTLTVTGIPDIDVSPASLEITLEEGAADQLTANVANAGNGLLQVYDICDEETVAPRASAEDPTLSATSVSTAADTRIDPAGNVPMAVLDDFNRPNGPIGPKWTDQNGTFNVVSNAAKGGTLALATYDGVTSNAIEADVEVIGTSLQYTGLVLAYADISTNYFIKVQQASPYAGQFTHAAFYYGNNGPGHFFDLDTPFSTAHMKVALVGNTVTLTFSEIDGGSGTQTYTYTYPSSTGGNGIGICGYQNIARIDNFATSEGVTCVCSPDAPWMLVSPTSGTVNPGEDMDVTVSFDASGLTEGTYEGNIKVSSNDPDEGCITVPVTLTVTPISQLALTTNPATNLTPTSVTLNGVVDSLGSSSYVDVYFVAGLSTSYTYVIYVDRMTSSGSYKYDVPSGLSPGTTYHYAAALVDNYGEIVYGNDVTFTYVLPTVTTNPATDVTPTSVTFNGVVDSLGSASYVDVYFVAGLSTSYFYVVYMDTITAPDSFSLHIPSGLSPGTTYHYALALMDNHGEIIYGNDVSFTTSSGP
jgi:hypothetical protein